MGLEFGYALGLSVAIICICLVLFITSLRPQCPFCAIRGEESYGSLKDRLFYGGKEWQCDSCKNLWVTEK